MGLSGLKALGLEAPVTSKTALIIIETGGCFADGIRAATGATVGHRTLRVEDLGKIAATFTEMPAPAFIPKPARTRPAYTPHEAPLLCPTGGLPGHAGG
jgi:hypothetical protein